MLLAKDPKQRPAATQFRAHDWLLQDGYVQEKQPNRNPDSLGHLSYFHRAAMFSIASGLSMQDFQGLYRVFQTMDTDNSGVLTVEELATGLERCGIQQDAHTLMAILDLDQDGCVSYTEFLAGALQHGEELTENQVRYAFDMFDLDGDGLISMHELRLMLSGDGPLTDVLPDGQTVEQVMEEVAEGDESISLAQFREYLTSKRNKTSIALAPPLPGPR